MKATEKEDVVKGLAVDTSKGAVNAYWYTALLPVNLSDKHPVFRRWRRPGPAGFMSCEDLSRRSRDKEETSDVPVTLDMSNGAANAYWYTFIAVPALPTTNIPVPLAEKARPYRDCVL